MTNQLEIKIAEFAEKSEVNKLFVDYITFHATHKIECYYTPTMDFLTTGGEFYFDMSLNRLTLRNRNSTVAIDMNMTRVMQHFTFYSDFALYDHINPFKNTKFKQETGEFYENFESKGKKRTMRLWRFMDDDNNSFVDFISDYFHYKWIDTLK